MPFHKFLRKNMFPVPKTKTIRNILDILVGDWKNTGTLNQYFCHFILIETFYPLELAMNNIMFILVTHLCMYKKIFPWVFYILLRAVTVTEKQARVKYQVSGPSNTPFENITSLTKKVIDTNV